jgi:hypothetical protein
MKAKSIVTVLLLAFVVASLAFLIFKGTGDKSASSESAEPASQQIAQQKGSSKNVGVDNVVIVYYFHGDTRCNTCRKIEAYTKEAIEKGFAKELESGRLVWKTVNVEEGDNEHFIDDYELSTRTVVLSNIDKEEEMRWTKLERVWQLVKNKEEFVDYIIENTNKYLAGQDG